MMTFAEKLSAYLAGLSHTLYEISLDVGLDPSNVDKILYAKRKTTFDKRLEVLERLSGSSLTSLDFPLLAGWLAQDYLPEDAFKVALLDDLPPETAQKALSVIRQYGIKEILKILLERESGQKNDKV